MTNSLVHPRMYLESQNLKTKTIKQSLKMVGILIINILERIANKIIATNKYKSNINI